MMGAISKDSVGSPSNDLTRSFQKQTNLSLESAMPLAFKPSIKPEAKKSASSTEHATQISNEVRARND